MYNIEEKAAVVAGCGEIGGPISQLSRGGFAQVILVDPTLSPPEDPCFPVEALHIAFPGSLKDFVPAVIAYAERYRPSITLVHSSSEPGLVEQIAAHLGEDSVVHSQVHGKHQGQRMRSDMLRYPRFVATRSDAAFEKARAVLIKMGHAPDRILRLNSPLAGELSKLLATTFYGYLIVWTQEVERLSDRSGIPYDELMSFLRLESADFSIAGKFPGVIGGHCVMPNIDILRRTYPSSLWEYLKRSNDEKKARVQ
jgi:hypothetical protein